MDISHQLKHQPILMIWFLDKKVDRYLESAEMDRIRILGILKG